MKMIDVQCPTCKAVRIDVLIRDGEELPRCESMFQRPHDTADGEQMFDYPCNTLMGRVHLGHAAGVIADSIPGGVLIHNGLCNADGTPRRYDSKTEIAKEAIRRGMTNHVVHQGSKGGDKSEHTSRWV